MTDEKDKKVKIHRAKKDRDNDDKISSDRSDINEPWNPFQWMRDMEKHFMDEFRQVGFGSWMGGDPSDDREEGRTGGRGDPFTKGSRGKSAGWEYHYQTGMDGPEIRTWGDVKPEDIEKFLAGRGTPMLGPSGESRNDKVEAADAEGGQEWNPFDMFRDIFEGFSTPFFKNMRRALGSAESDSGEAVEVDAKNIEVTGETPVTPETEEDTQAASGAKVGQDAGKGGKPVVEPFTDTFYDNDGNLVGTLELPGATQDTLKVTVRGKTIHVEVEGPLRRYVKDIKTNFALDPAKVTCTIYNGICELRADKA